MKRLSRIMACALLIAGSALAGATLPTGDAADPRVASSLPEVRLRKLHLVRPDLIQYPLSYEVYC